MNIRSFLLLIVYSLSLTDFAYSQKKALTPEDYIVTRITDQTGQDIVGIVVPGKPPDGHREPIAYPNRSTVTLANVPAYDWSFGCSATSASMAAGYYDNNGYTNMYAGPANGGVAPMDNSNWGTVVINGETRSLCPLSATMDGLDGRTGRGHVDDYWIQYNSSAPDPYITNGWTQHTYGDCTGDYMATNQSALANVDGSTLFYNYTNGNPLYNYTGGEPTQVDGCHGMRDFYESRGYSVLENYNQYIYGYNGNTLGFTFNQYKNEIDSGRVVLIQVSGHTMLGYGYDDATNLVYLHDTWDYSSHTMTWGGSYSGMQHYGVTVVKLQPVYFMNANFIASDIVPNINTTIIFTDLSNGNPAPNSWTWSISPAGYTFVDGTSSTSRHPHVQFTSAGYYTVTLLASNGTNNDTEIKTDYIHAIDCGNYTIPLTEDYSDGALPLCWSIVDHQGNGQVWSFNNPGNRSIGTATSANGFAILDSRYYGSGNSQNCDLVSPMLNLSSAVAVILNFQHYFLSSAGSSATLSYSANGGNSWTILQTWTASTGNPAIFSQDLSSQLCGKDSVMFKWNYSGTYGFYWALDDIDINSAVAGLWDGSSSNDWNTASNWADGNIPGSSSNIVIHPLAANWPVFTGNFVVGTNCESLTIKDSAQMTVNGNFTISSTKSLTFSSSGKLTVTGDWTDLGIFNCGSGTVDFAGTSSSSITADNILSNDVSNYTRSTFTVGMTTLTGATNTGMSGTNLYTDISLGFSFIYMGNTYTQARLTTNGYLSLNQTGTGIPTNENLWVTNLPNATLAPWWDGLKTDGSSLVRYKTEGTGTNHIFSAEWYNVLAYSSGASSRISFQLKIYEATRVIEFYYGTVGGGTHNASEGASIGIEDATGGTNHFIEGTTGSMTTGVSNLKSNANWPTVNYRFTPATQDKVFYNLVVSKSSGILNLNGNIIVNGTLTVQPGANFKIPSGKTITVF